MKHAWMTAGEGEAVVMLHSSMSSKSQWFSLMETLKKTHKVVAVDLYGYGEAPGVPTEKMDNFSMDDELALIREALGETLGGEARFHLVGHSYGGAVALHLALAMPERIQSLSLYEPMANHVLSETDASLYQEQKALMAMIIEEIERGNYKYGASMFVDFFNGEGIFSLLPEKLQTLLAGCVSKMPLDYLASARPSLRMGRYRSLSIPTCLMAGKQSPDFSLKISQSLSGLIPSVDYHLVDAGHMAPITHGPLVNPIIVDHVRRHTSLH